MQGEKKVLIVDDDETLCQLLSAGLRLKGWSPVSVGDFESALSEAKQGYDVALLDPGLPDSPPIQTIENIFRLKAAGIGSVYVVSGAPIDDGMRTLCSSHGADGVMSKCAAEFMAGLVAVFG